MLRQQLSRRIKSDLALWWNRCVPWQHTCATRACKQNMTVTSAIRTGSEATGKSELWSALHRFNHGVSQLPAAWCCGVLCSLMFVMSAEIAAAGSDLGSSLVFACMLLLRSDGDRSENILHSKCACYIHVGSQTFCNPVDSERSITS